MNYTIYTLGSRGIRHTSLETGQVEGGS